MRNVVHVRAIGDGKQRIGARGIKSPTQNWKSAVHQRERRGGNSVQVQLRAVRHALLRERRHEGIVFIFLAEKNVAIDALELLPRFIVGVHRNGLAHHGVVAAHFV